MSGMVGDARKRHSQGIPPAVLLARLENDLETLRLDLRMHADALTMDTILRAQKTAQQIREAL